MKGKTTIYLVLCLCTVALTFGNKESFKVHKNANCSFTTTTFGTTPYYPTTKQPKTTIPFLLPILCSSSSLPPTSTVETTSTVTFDAPTSTSSLTSGDITIITSSLPPQSTTSSLPPRSTTSSLPPQSTTSSLPPQSTTSSLPPQSTTSSLPPQSTTSSLPPQSTTSTPIHSTSSSLPPQSTTSSLPPPTQVPGPACTRDYSCLDCNTARICAPTDDEHEFFEVKRFTCPTSRPWCDPSSGTCTVSRPEGCKPHPYPVPGDFTCMRDGFYPNVNNCSQYFQCVADSPYLLECPSTHPYYAPYFQQCTAEDGYCANYGNVCGQGFYKDLIRNMNNMFAYCENNQVIVVDRCIGGYVLNLTSQNCEPSCPHAGLFPSDQDCTQYYRCNPRTNSLGETDFIMTTNLTCPEGMGFLEEAYQCVNRSLVPNCQVQPQFFS